MAKMKESYHGDEPFRRTEEVAAARLIEPLNEDLRDAWEKLRAFLGELGEQRIYGSPNAIMFAKKICYAFVRPRKSYLEVWFFLPRYIEGLKFHVNPAKTKYSLMFKLVHPDQVEEPLTDWLREAYELVPAEVASGDETGADDPGDSTMKKKTAKKTAKAPATKAAKPSAKKPSPAGKDWRTATLAQIRKIVMAADSGVREERKWGDVPTWSCDGIISTGETYKSVVKMTFAKGAKLKDPAKLFNASLEGNVRRAIDFRERDKINAKALTALVREAIKLNRVKKKK